MTQSRPGDIFQPGDLLNNTYRIEAMLGRGGTSEVYKAKSEISGRIVALKALRSEFSSNEDYLALMTREEDIRDIQHDAIVRYFDTQRMPDGTVYLVMDYVEGPGLDQEMKARGLSVDALLTIGEKVAEGLVAAHERNIVHRDLSPDNIILRGGDPAQAVIIDFGIAKDTNPGAETIVGNEFAGKYAYAAPEQLAGQTDARSDIYALGALLLAAFRGQTPDSGGNPMEVVEKKRHPLDTAGVPAPLCDLIARMSAPDPADRFQSARDLLSAIRAADAPAPDEATVIAAPPPRSKPKKRTKPEPVRRRRGLFVPLLLVLIAVGGAGLYFSGVVERLMGPDYPPADPFLLVVEKPADAPPYAEGVAPSPEFAADLRADLAADGGRTDLLLASGNIPQDWPDRVRALAQSLSSLPAYRLEANGVAIRITGESTDPQEAAQLQETLTQELTAPYSGEVSISFRPPMLASAELEILLNTHADCGALMLEDPPPLGYGPQDPITITGRLAEAATRVALFDAISALAGAREVALDVEVLSPVLCQIETALPDAPSAGVGIRFGFGDRADENDTGRYFVGENPVIDVLLPEGMADGFLYVSVVDVSGNVFHLLPNVNRTENSVAALRRGGESAIRVAYALKEAEGTNKLAFLVDDTVLGKSRIVAIWAAQELFDGIRPTTESVEGYADALKQARSRADLAIRGLDSRILVTATP